jgi:lipopolysaccharide export system protein LptC
MIGRNLARSFGGAGSSARGRAPLRPLGQWVASLPGNPYSRRVAIMKLALPTIGIVLLLLVAIWPRVAPLFDRLRFSAIDLKEARELRMMNPRYAGTDRSGHPFVITAAVGRQVPDRDDLMSLDKPEAHLKNHSGANIVVTADSGVYQSQTQFLDLFGNVTLTHENGTVIVTSAARLDAANNAAQGNQPVEGHGPSGDINAQGFEVIDKGDIVKFIGATNMWIKATKTGTPAAPPAELPAPVAQAAAQIEAKVTPPAPPAAHPPAAIRPVAHPAPAHPAIKPAAPKPAPKKPG